MRESLCILLPFRYNSHDTLFLKVKGRFTGMPAKQLIVTGSVNKPTIIYHYRNNQLDKIEYFHLNSRILR